MTPHPLNDLTEEQVAELARAAYPVIIKQLTGQGMLEKETKVNYVRPAVHDGTHRVRNPI